MSLIGQTFSRLHVLEQVESTNKNKKWKCICDCGSVVNVFHSSLTTGHTKSCGCYQKFWAKIKHRKDKGVSGLNRLLRRYKQQAKSREISFCLSKKYFECITQQNCYYCNSPPTQISVHSNKSLTEEGREHSKYVYNGIDRLNSAKNYTENNTVSCCGACNRIKGSLSEHDFLELVNKIYKHSIKNRSHGK